MPRANRHYLPGHVWHITHRCHKGEFLLQFSKDRRQWMKWLFDARKRYGIKILNYAVTCNHTHLLVVDEVGCEVIPNSIQLVAGRTGQDYNQRKGRKGAFWEDRYHATAVETGLHLIQCLIYIDMNMVRAGVVTHPLQWPCCGYHEIQQPRERYRLIDHQRLAELLRIDSRDDLRRHHKSWVEKSLRSANHVRESKWTESIAVGSRAFVERTREQLGVRARSRSVVAKEGAYELREPETSYNAHSEGKNSTLSSENTCYWDVSH